MRILKHCAWNINWRCGGIRKNADIHQKELIEPIKDKLLKMLGGFPELLFETKIASNYHCHDLRVYSPWHNMRTITEVLWSSSLKQWVWFLAWKDFAINPVSFLLSHIHQHSVSTIWKGDSASAYSIWSSLFSSTSK